MAVNDLRPLYPVDAWRIRELDFEPAVAARNETIFALANGHLGLRGNVDEEAGNVVHGTYVNGFYEETPIAYGESAFGYARNHQVMLNVADGKRIQLVVGEEPSTCPRASSRRTSGRSTCARGSSLGPCAGARRAAASSRSRAAGSCRSRGRASPRSTSGSRCSRARRPLRVVSRIHSRVHNQEASDDPRVGAHLPEGALHTIDREASGTWGAVVQRTGTTRLAIAAAVDHVVHADDAVRRTLQTSSLADEEGVALTIDVVVPPGGSIGITKLLAYCTSLDHPEDGLVATARDAIDEIRGMPFDALVEEQRAVLDRFWAVSDVELDGDGALQQGVRFNLFSLFQSAGRDGRTSIAAKGLTGEGYEGHYFWDTEIFALPFFAYTQPDIARSLLQYRASMLDKARARAAELSQRGALYPWRTIGGEEASAYYPASTAQYHIDADIAYAIRRYVTATGDRSLLLEGGAEIVFETARLWADLGDYIAAQDGAFCINEVTGPDEYTALVNNNGYTNLMARANLRYAAQLAAELSAEAPDTWSALTSSIGLDVAEVGEWTRAADRMRIPRDAILGIHAQDDSFLDRAPWDFAGTPRDRYPLLLHYHPLVIYRHQVLKQSDIVLAQVLLGSQFSTAEKKRNFDYYDPLTTGDSSLSPCIQSVAAAELGYDGPAYRYFLQTARMDLDDVNGNVSHGVHVAAMAGTWVSLVSGFGGLRDDDGRLSFAPRLPTAWTRLAFRLRVADALLRVTMTRHETTYALEAGGPLELRHFGGR